MQIVAKLPRSPAIWFLAAQDGCTLPGIHSWPAVVTTGRTSPLFLGGEPMETVLLFACLLVAIALAGDSLMGVLVVFAACQLVCCIVWFSHRSGPTSHSGVDC